MGLMPERECSARPDGRRKTPPDDGLAPRAVKQRCPAGRRRTRRALLHTGLATAAAALGVVEALSAAEGGKATLQPYETVQPEKFAWGWIRWLINGQIDPHAEMTLGMVRVEPNQCNPLHVHPNSAEYLHVLSGTCEHLVGERWVVLKPSDTLRIPQGMPHQARTKEQPLLALVVYNTPTRQMVPVTERNRPDSATSPDAGPLDNRG